MGLPRDLAATHGTLCEMLEQARGLLPEDTVVLAKLWPGGSAQPHGTLSQDLERLVRLGFLRRVFIGSEAHLTLPRARAERTAAHGGEAQDTEPSSEEDAEREVFELQVRVDTETERVLLYRVSLIVLVIIGFAVAREWLLWANHL